MSLLQTEEAKEITAQTQEILGTACPLSLSFASCCVFSFPEQWKQYGSSAEGVAMIDSVTQGLSAKGLNLLESTSREYYNEETKQKLLQAAADIKNTSEILQKDESIIDLVNQVRKREGQVCDLERDETDKRVSTRDEEGKMCEKRQSAGEMSQED